jgi:hypothetical protein
MKGFIIFNNASGALVFSRLYEEKLTKVPDHQSATLDNSADPLALAAHFFALIKMTELMVEEYKAEVGGDAALDLDVNTRMCVKSGFRGMRSENLDYCLEHHDAYPLTAVLFYDGDLVAEQIMKSLASKILEVFVYKYEKKLQKGNYNIP